MQINNSSTKENSLYHDALSLLGISETDTTTFPIATFIRYANAWYRRFVFYVWRSSGTWQFNDINSTQLPEGVTTLIDGQDNYTLDSTALDVLECYAKNIAGDWVKLLKINPHDLPIPRDEVNDENGFPNYWFMVGDSIKIIPAPSSVNTTLASGLKIILDRDINEFTTTDTTKEPGFIKAFHRLISLGAAYDFARSKELVNRIALIKPDLDKMITEFEEYHSKRSRVDENRIIIKNREKI